MLIEIDQEFDAQGNVIGHHVIDSADVQHVAVITALNVAPAGRAAQGWNIVSKHKLANPGETRWQFLVRQINAAGAPPNLKALNLV